VGWWLAGLSHTVAGRRVVIGLSTLVGLALVLLLRIGFTRVLDRAPTRPLALAILLGASGRYAHWLVALAVLLAIGLAGMLLGPRGVAYAQRQPPGVNDRRSARTVSRRQPRRTAGAELTTIDRASVWRSPPLRRGIFVLGLLPGAAAAAFRVDWPGLALVAGLVTAGAGLLFGINAFSLDGPGSLWLASAPVERRTRLLAKLRVVVEVCLVSSAIAVLAGVTRIRGAADPVVVVNVVTCAAACTAVVTARCLRSSVVRPHRADLRGSRDTPAPHGAMAAESVTLAALTTTTSLVITGFAAAGSTAGVLLVGGAAIALAVRSITQTVRMFGDPEIGARVAVTVATG
jgi:hypothetical protein